MRNRIVSLLALFALAVGPTMAVEINFTSPAFEIGVTSHGTPLTSNFNFAIGSFGNFTPTANNTSEWLANFTSLGVTSWDETFTQYAGTVTLSSNEGAFSTSSQAFVWGYDFTSGSTAEWILLTNSNWTFPSSSTFDSPTWDVTATGTYTVVGTIASALGSNPYLQTAAVSSVPEPATLAALFGAVALGAGLLRRKAHRLAV